VSSFAGLGAWNRFILAAVLFILETFLPGVHFLWFGIAAIVVAALALFTGVT
jgi:membrane protein implicated in regulation of membrane protease activity